MPVYMTISALLYCVLELTISVTAIYVTASTHCAYPREDGQAEFTLAD